MNIAPVAGSAGTSPKQSSVVEALKQLKADLTNQITKVKESSDDAKTKAEKIKQLNEQIAMVDAQIQQAMAGEKQKELRESMEKAQEKAAEQQAEKAKESGVVIAASLGKVIALQNNMAEYRSLGKVRTQLKGETRVAEGEMELSAASGGSIKYQLGVIAGNTSKLAKVENEMGKTAGEIRAGVEDSVKAGTKEAEKSRENNDDKTDKQEDKTPADGAAGTEGKPQAGGTVTLADQAGGPGDETGKKDEERQHQPGSVDVVV